MTTEKVRQCGNCKYFEQGESSCFCANPEQKKETYKTYVYYNFSCSLFKKGISERTIDREIKFHEQRISELKQLNHIK